MAKTPVSPEPSLTRRQASRARREAAMQRWIVTGAVATAVVIAGLLIYAYVNEQVLVPNRPVATVNGDVITVKQFRDRVRLELYFQTLNPFGSPTDPRVTAQQVLDSLVDEALVRQHAKAMGIDVSDADVKRRAELAFGYDGGTPEPTATPFPTDPPAQDTTATVTATFVMTPSPTATRTPDPSLTAAPTQLPTVPPTATSTVDLTTTATPTLVPTATLTLTPFPTRTPISAEAFGTQSGEFFASGVELTGLTNDQIITVWHEKIRSAIYSERLLVALKLEADQTRETVHAAHILVATEDEAKAALDRLAQGETFEELAAELSTDPSNAFRGGDLGWFNKEDMVTAFADVAFATEPGTISQPVQTQFGWHVVKVYEKAAVPLTASEKESSIQQKFVDLVKQWRDESKPDIEDNWAQYVPQLKAVQPAASAP